jgi:HSP20 family protein
MATEIRNKEKRASALMPWRPFFDMPRWEREMENRFGSLFDDKIFPLREEREWPGWRLGVRGPAVDLYEQKDEIIVKAELPGLTKDDIEVNIADKLLTLKGEKRKEDEVKEEDYYRAERAYGSFVRSVELPAEVTLEKVKAVFKNGVLEIRLPKSEQAKQKEIRVKID